MSEATRIQKLRTEAAATCARLDAASAQLTAWADSLAADFFGSSVLPHQVRELAQALAHQGGRLSMATDMSQSRRIK